jgi:hypothetical protein
MIKKFLNFSIEVIRTAFNHVVYFFRRLIDKICTKRVNVKSG